MTVVHMSDRIEVMIRVTFLLTVGYCISWSVIHVGLVCCKLLDDYSTHVS